MIYFTTLTKPIKRLKRIQWAGGLNYQKQMPVPDVLIIEEDRKETGGFFLNRYTSNGEFGGDTWHQNLQDAKYQAIFEYGKSVGEWEVAVESDTRDTEENLLHILNKFKKN